MEGVDARASPIAWRFPWRRNGRGAWLGLATPPDAGSGFSVPHFTRGPSDSDAGRPAPQLHLLRCQDGCDTFPLVSGRLVLCTALPRTLVVILFISLQSYHLSITSVEPNLKLTPTHPSYSLCVVFCC